MADVFRCHGPRLARRTGRASRPTAAPGDRRDRSLPHRGARRACRAAARLRPCRDRLQLVPQSPLSQVPGPRARGLDRGTARRAAAGPLLPRGLHAAGPGRRDRPPEQGDGLRHAVPRRRRDAARIAADPRHLGAEIGFVACCTPGGRTCSTTRTSTASCPPAASRRTGARWIACRPASSCRCGSSAGCSGDKFLERLAGAFAAGGLRPRRPRAAGRDRRLRRPLRRCCAGSTGWSTPSARSAGPSRSSPISALHPPRRHRQQPAPRHGRRQGQLPLEGPPGRAPRRS